MGSKPGQGSEVRGWSGLGWGTLPCRGRQEGKSLTGKEGVERGEKRPEGPVGRKLTESLRPLPSSGTTFEERADEILQPSTEADTQKGRTKEVDLRSPFPRPLSRFWTESGIGVS